MARKFEENGVGWEKVEQKSGNISVTRKDREKVTMEGLANPIQYV